MYDELKSIVREIKRVKSEKNQTNQYIQYIQYSQYIAEQIDKNLAEQCYISTSYYEYK
jgi:hypothetical protein